MAKRLRWDSRRYIRRSWTPKRFTTIFKYFWQAAKDFWHLTGKVPVISEIYRRLPKLEKDCKWISEDVSTANQQLFVQSWHKAKPHTLPSRQTYIWLVHWKDKNHAFKQQNNKMKTEYVEKNNQRLQKIIINKNKKCAFFKNWNTEFRIQWGQHEWDINGLLYQGSGNYWRSKKLT